MSNNLLIVIDEIQTYMAQHYLFEDDFAPFFQRIEGPSDPEIRSLMELRSQVQLIQKRSFLEFFLYPRNVVFMSSAGVSPTAGQRLVATRPHLFGSSDRMDRFFIDLEERMYQARREALNRFIGELDKLRQLRPRGHLKTPSRICANGPVEDGPESSYSALIDPD
jgi:hypothetical protein